LAAHLRLAIQLGINLPLKLGNIDADLFQNRPRHAFLILDQRCQQMQRLHLRMPLLRRQRLCPLHRFLRFNRQFVESKCHKSKPRGI